MNYYEHHLGDWAAATAHLSWDEDMAYTRLIRAYYHSEQAIPHGQQYRMARAVTPAQRRAVDQVLMEFFFLADGVYRQKRADAEIARYLDKQRKAKASADARWSQSERNANASPKPMRTHTERTATDDANALRTQSEGNATRERNALQTPDTINTPQPPSGVTPLTDADANASPPALPSAHPRPARKCPSTFAVTAEMRSWAAANAPGVDLETETAKLRDHTFRTAISDWPGAWRNWLRRCAENATIRHTNGHRITAREARSAEVAKFLAPLQSQRQQPVSTQGEIIDMEPANAARRLG